MSNNAAFSPLTEELVMNGFHSFLKNALAQAKAERLLDEETLSSAEADLMVAGPALCLFFAALRSSTTPPSISVPRAGLPRDTPPLTLSFATCPPAFQGFFHVWSQAVPQIKSLPSDQQHDLARIICNHEPLTPAPTRHQSLQRLAADLRAVAIEISQRRTFQERYATDLQAALDHGRPSTPDGRRTPSPYRAAFVPPPIYNEKGGSQPTSPTGSSSGGPNALLLSPTSPTSGMFITNPDDGNRIPGMFGSEQELRSRSRSRHSTPAPQTTAPPLPSRGHTRAASSQSAGAFLQPPTSAGPSTPSSSPSGSTFPRPASPTILTVTDPSINVIRETLYASLGDVLSRTPTLKPVIKTDPTRAYFASLGLAILDFSEHSITSEGNVKAVLGHELELKDVPVGYQPLMKELAAISTRVKEMASEDDEKAMEILTSDSEAELPEPRMDHVKRMLEKGIGRGWGEDGDRGDAEPTADETGTMNAAASSSQRRRTRTRSRSPEGTALQLTNRINALALNMMRLEAFRERQQDVFKVLAGVR